MLVWGGTVKPSLRLPNGTVLMDGGNGDLIIGKPLGTTAEIFDLDASSGASWGEVAWGGLTRIFGALHWVDGRVIGDPACSSRPLPWITQRPDLRAGAGCVVHREQDGG
ncbi:MAG: hypothetical protein JRH20_15885 [Deltaproteobacteria bacterium]|nr:hypothetical protein [Deltaproteobacteria bacterium]